MTAKEIIVNEKIEEGKRRIKKYVMYSAGAGFVPVPLLDMVILSGLQLKMISSLSSLFDVKFSKGISKNVIGSLVGGVLPVSIAPMLGSLLKIIPIVGQTIGAVTMPITSGAATYAVGKVFLQHFASGGTFLDFDPEKVRAYFAEQFKEGQKVAADVAGTGTATGAGKAKSA